MSTMDRINKRRRLEKPIPLSYTHYDSVLNLPGWNTSPQNLALNINSQWPADEFPTFATNCDPQYFQGSLEIPHTGATGADFISNDPTEIVCFGTLTSLTIHNKAEPGQTLLPGTILTLGADCAVYSIYSAANCGNLSDRDTQLLELFIRERITFDLQWFPIQPTQSTSPERPAIWATLYGLREVAEDLGDTLQTLDLYLQDPIHALRDAVYFNPQRFSNDPHSRTNDFKTSYSIDEQVPTVRDEALVVTDVLNIVTAEFVLHETEGSPHLLTQLMNHQKEGLTFMLRRESGWRLQETGQDVWSESRDSIGRISYVDNIAYSSCYTKPLNFRGGIVADLMGLGKTLLMISLIAHDKVLADKLKSMSKDEGSGKGTLLVLPPSLLHNWEEELSKHLSKGQFDWRRHHGSHRIQKPDDIGDNSVFLTTYPTLANEWQNPEKSVVFSHNWHRVILDEAHEIKDLTTAKSQAVCALMASRRWVVTGTPIQNRLSELFSLFHFLQLHPYGEKKKFNETIVDPCLRGEEAGVQALVRLLQHTMLRRSKNVIGLPERQDHRRLLRFSDQEQEAYNIAKRKAIECLEEAMISRKPAEGYRNALQKINSLRFICELGCTTKSNVQLTTPSTAGFNGLLSIGTPDGASTPSTTTDDVDEDLDLEGSKEDSGNMATNFDECFPSCPPSRVSICPSPRDPSTQPPVSINPWPTKIQALVEDLQSCTATTKSIVFSYRTTILDVANVALRTAGIPCVQIDGKTKAKRRGQLISLFSSSETVQVLLLSLGCGAVGLTLTAASRAYLLEPQWNPSIEEQALARIHRLGQTQKVTTIRFVISESIEEYVLRVQDGKKDLMSLLNPGLANADQVISKLRQLQQFLR